MTEPRTEAGRALLAERRTHVADEDDTLIAAILAIEAEAATLDVERLARALMDAANNGDRPITQTAYATATRVLEALADD